jgi:predicted ATPase/DNA-binding XRE family transcriptional regulator
MGNGKDERTFGVLLREYRQAAGLTQEALAERAGLGTRSIQHLERGESQPQHDTAQRLAIALALTEAQRARFEALAQPSPRRRGTGAGDGASHAAEAAPWSGSAHNLPLQLTSFIGRERELAEVARLLGGMRLLTLTGTGGVGKTRLALQVATSQLDRYADGIRLIELAPLADPAGVPAAVATALGIREEAGQPLLATLLAALCPRRLLLVLDNCEHLLDACAALVAALLHGCPQLAVLATSREALGIAGEGVWRVPSLALPELEPVPAPEVLAQVEAVRLFGERARAVQPQFAVTAQNARAVTQICRRLDGIPLALELAAAQLRGLSSERLAARLDQRFRLLTGGSRTAPARQQTLQATVDWSYGLLGVAEQRLFTRLAIFSGGFTLEAAEAVCTGGPVARGEVLALLLRLVDQSLVVVEGQAGEVERYRLLETLRQYGRERSLAGGETEDLDARHAAYYRALAEGAEGDPCQQPAAWADRMEAEWMNFRQALHWAVTVGAAQEGLRLAGALWDFWHDRGAMAEGVQWLAQVLALPGTEARTTARATALAALAYLRRSARFMVGVQASGADARAQAAEAVAIARETGDKFVLACALRVLGGWTEREGYAAARALLEECLALWRELDLPGGVDGTLNRLGDLAYEQGDTVAAHARWSEGLRLSCQVGNQNGIASELGDLGMLAYHQGDYATARGHITESLALYRAIHSRMGICWLLGSLGAVARAQGDTAIARTCYEEKLGRWREVGDRAGIAATLAELGAVAQQEGGYEQAQALFQEALALRRALGDSAGVAGSLAHLGNLAAAQGDQERAARLYHEGLNLLAKDGDRVAAALCFEGLAAVARAGGQPEHAARLYGAGAAFRAGTFVLNVWDDRVARDGQIAALRAVLGEEAFATAWAAGQAMTPDQAAASTPANGADA